MIDFVMHMLLTFGIYIYRIKYIFLGIKKVKLASPSPPWLAPCARAWALWPLIPLSLLPFSCLIKKIFIVISILSLAYLYA